MDNIRIAGVDLGSTYTGVAVIEVDPLYRKIVSIEAITVSTPDIYSGLYYKGKPHEELTSTERNEIINTIVTAWLLSKNVDYVTFEQPFMNRFRPMSYGVLITQMNKLAFLIDVYMPEIPMDSYAVQTCKKSVGAAGIKGKDVIKTSILKHDELSKVLPEGYDDLSEHAIDAILVAYTGLLDKR